MVILTALRSKRRLAAIAVCAVASALASSAALATRSASGSNIYYCGYYIPGYTDCYSYVGDPYGRAVGKFTTNHAYIPYGGYGFVCEHTYIYGDGTISRRCGGNYVSMGSCSGSDLWPYGAYYLDGRAGNNQSLYETVSGHAYSETCV